MSKKLKIAVLIPSQRVEKWKHKLLSELKEYPSAEVSLFLNPEKEKKGLNSLFYRWYEKFDRKFFFESGVFKELEHEENALEKVDLSQGEAGSGSDNFDIILNLSNAKCPEKFKKPRNGIWFFRFGECDGFWHASFLKEVYENNPISKCSLNALVNGKERVLYESYSSTNPFSLFINQNKNYWKASDFVLRCLKHPHSHSEQDKLSLKEFPSNFYMFKYFFKLAYRMLQQKTQRKLFKEQWFIALTDKFKSFRIINPPKDRFFADPFLLEEKGKTYIFFEDYYYEKNKGLISCMELGENNFLSAPETVMEKSCHLSYPFIFREGNSIYMIPETLGKRTIELYRAVDFPKKWELSKILFKNINAVDTTLLKYNGKYWLFSNIADKAGYLCDELFLFYSDSLFGEWTAHPKNPIVSDVRTARCAGKIFIDNGNLIRPSQETSIRYGYSLNFNKIEILSEHDYRETLVKKVMPEKISGNLAIHSYNRENGVEIIDGMRLIRK